jgi:2-polyprenyl-6-methoxyphenol hydroxylase-like FAD-dependent oxidoreductase
VEAVILERHDDLAKIQVGIGMVLWPNGTHALRAGDLHEAVVARGAVMEQVEFRRSVGGGRLHVWEMGSLGRTLGSPAVGISRADVHKALCAALGAGTLRLGQKVIGYHQDPDGVTVRTEDGDEVRGEVLIGADGLRSGTREKETETDETYPPYAGYTLWHAIIPTDEALVPAGQFRLSLGRGDRFVSFPVDDERTYWSALSHVAAGGRDKGRRLEALRTQYASYAPDVRGLIDATPEAAISRVDIYGGRGLPKWGSGRVSLLGDAAHPMTTILGQGACMALEDAAALGRHFTGARNVESALRGYEAERLDRTAQFQKLVRRLSPGAEGRLRAGLRDQAIRRVFQRGPGGQLQALISEPFEHAKELSHR